MGDFSEEELMAFADGEAEPAVAARIEARIVRDELLRQRVDVYRSTGRSLGHLFDAAISDPIPDRILDTIRTTPAAQLAKGADREAAPSWKRSVAARLWARVSEATLLRPLVLAGTAAAGVTVGWIAALNLGGQGEQWRPDFVASAQMRRALDVSPSGTSVDIALSDGKRWMLRPTLSFRAKDGGYCRQYELSDGSSQGLAGLYCKGSDGKWRGRIQVAASVQPRTGKLAPAAGPGSEALEAAVDKLIDGEALNKQEEETAISAKWSR